MARIQRWSQILGLIAIGLTVTSAALRASVKFLGSPDESPIGVAARLFNVQAEGNIPTWYSSLLLLAASVLIWQVVLLRSKENRPDHMGHLVVLAIGFLYMSIDEAARIHEQLNDPLGEWLQLGGIFRWAWVIVAIPLVIVLAFVYSSWIRSLPRDIGRLVILGGAVFVVGSVGLEMVGAQLLEIGMRTASGIAAQFEEFGEMLGVVIFIEAMLRYLRLLDWDGAVRFPGQASQPTRPN